MVDRIHPKAIYTSVEPEFQHLAHGPLHVGIAPIEVRLLLQICVVVGGVDEFATDELFGIPQLNRA